jgi:hypothetical protein
MCLALKLPDFTDGDWPGSVCATPDSIEVPNLVVMQPLGSPWDRRVGDQNGVIPFASIGVIEAERRVLRPIAVEAKMGQVE